jgi:hypothetical protein
MSMSVRGSSFLSVKVASIAFLHSKYGHTSTFATQTFTKKKNILGPIPGKYVDKYVKLPLLPLIPIGLVARIAASHAAGQGSIP